MVKQKLIRLTANSQDLIGKQCIFEATYNDGILIDENSQVALLSATLSRDIDNLIINSFNDIVSFQTVNGSLRQIRLPHGSYDGNTLHLLLDGMQDAMNATLSILPLDVDLAKTPPVQSGREQGMHVEVIVNDQNAVEIQFRRTKQVNAYPSSNAQLLSGVGTGDATGWRYSLYQGNQQVDRNTPPPSNVPKSLFVNQFMVQSPMIDQLGTASYIYSTIPISKGAGQLAVQIQHFLTHNVLIDQGQTGVMIGLLVKTDAILQRLQNATTNDDRIKPSEFAIGVSTNNDGHNQSPYQVKLPSSNVFVDTTVTPTKVEETVAGVVDDCDILSIRFSDGGVQMIFADNTMGDASSQYFAQRGRTLYAGGLPRRDGNGNEIEYIPYIGLYGDSVFTRIGSVVCNLMTDPVNTELMTETALVVPTPGKTPLCTNATLASHFNVIFNKESVAGFLGYPETNIDPTDSNKLVPPVIFVAPDPRTKLYNTNTYLVEMLSELVDSYDSFQQGRKNILAPIPISERTVNAGTGIVQFQPNNLVYVDLKNRKQRLIRNIRARIITDTYDSIEIEGLAEINLLIRSPE